MMQHYIRDKKVRNGQKQKDDVKRERSIKREQVLLTSLDVLPRYAILLRCGPEKSRSIVISSRSSTAQRKSKKFVSPRNICWLVPSSNPLSLSAKVIVFLCSAAHSLC